MAVKRDAVEDVYRLSPIQEGVLFHALHAERPGTYLQQFAYRLEGVLDAALFARAFQEAVDRHPALRTAFLWERQGRPLQVVARRAELPVTLESWPAGAPEEEEERIMDLLRRDQQRGMDLGKPPLLRLTLAQVGGGQVHHLLWTYHHLVLDGWSMSLVLDEVLARYTALAGGFHFDAPPPRPFRDYIAWLDRQDLAAAEAYWRRTLAGLAAAPLAANAGTGESGTAKRTLVLPATVRAALEVRAQRSGLTLNTLAQGAWALLLGRGTEGGEVVFGAVVSGRPPDLEGVEAMVGMFINTLPARVRIDPRRPLGDWLREIQTAQLEMRRFEYSPLSQIQAWSGVTPGVGAPLFDAILVFENRTLFSAGGLGDEPAGGALRVVPEEFQGETGYPLIAAVEPGEEGLALTLAWDRQRLDAVTVLRWLGHFAALLAAMDGDLGRLAGSLSPLTPQERQQLLREWNAPWDDRREAPGEECLHRSFAAQAARTPEAVAVEGDGDSDGEQLTYRELDRAADRLAHRLRDLGVGPEVVVGILLRRSVARIVAVFGVLKAGGAYLPLDPEQPAARLAAILEDSGAPVLLTRGGLAPGIAVPGLRQIDLEKEDADAGSVAGEPWSGVEPRHPAYVIYTSGSTGRPKGVVMPHREIGATLRWRQLEYPLGAGDRVLDTTSFTFDATLWTIFAPLLTGARLVLSLPEGLQGSSGLGEIVARHRITAMQLPPAWLRLFLEQLGAGDLSALRFVICGGEAMTGELQDLFFQRAGPAGAGLHNLYGPTEAALDTTWWPCRRGEWHRTVPIGRPIAGKEVYVLDRGLEPVPAGAAGELCIGGEGLARGYLGDPVLTASRFIPHPWGAPGARLYRSGDLARFLPDGNLEFAGRTDHQVKIRGYRIELGEIEAALERHPGIRQAAVTAWEETPGAARRLVAYVVLRAEDAPSWSDLRRSLGESLPEYMVPAVFVELGSLPLNASGKVDRARLPEPGPDRPNLGGGFVAPRDEREERLAEIWRAVLGIDRVGIHDNFFELGGDSILSLQIVGRARKAGLALTTRQLFAHQTVAELAAHLPGEAPAVRAEPGAAVGEVPLTPIQHWFFESVQTDPQHWNQAMLLTARRPFAPALLERAVAALAAHHDALRLRFTPAGGWRQVYAPVDGTVPFSHLDLAALPAARRAAAIEAAAREIQASLDLAHGPLLRAAVFSIGSHGAEPARLLLAVHHLAIDGVSWRLLLEDLTAVCVQLARGEAPSLPAKTSSFKQWAERLWEHAQSPAAAAQLGFWLGLEGALAEPLPRDRAGRNTERTRATVTVELSPEETRALLREVPRAFGARIEDALAAAVVLAFRAWTGSPRLLLDLEGHGREDLFADIDLSRTVGWFTTEYPVLLSLGAQDDPIQALRAVRDELRRIPERGIGFGLLRYLHADGAVRERLRALPRAEVVLNYLGQFDSTSDDAALWAAAGESSGPPRGLDGERPYLFDLNGSVSDGRLVFDWSYSDAIHDRSTAERLAANFLLALRGIAARCGTAGAGARVPADFPLARVDQALLDGLAAGGQVVEDLYPLSPMQQGLLFDSLYAGGGVYVMQLAWVVRGDLDAAAFTAAWQRVMDRHPVLRTAFVWEGCDEPLQAVLRGVRPVFAEDDWRGLDAAEQERRLQDLVAQRRAGFDLTRAPLLRFDLVRLAEGAWRFLWSSHHLVLDGWSAPLLVAELLTVYAALRRGEEPRLPARRPYRDYIAWLGERDLAAAERFFRRALGGYAGAVPLEALRLPPELRRRAESHGEAGMLLPAGRTADLQAFVRRHRLTLSSLVQGAWALVLSCLAGSRDVVFGVTVSGRPAALAGAEEMIGIFINTLPARLQVVPESGLAGWLREHQERQAELAEHEDTPLAKIQQWCAPARGASLFESIVVFESYPEPDETAEQEAGLAVGELRHWIREGFPLILEVGPGPQLSLRLRYDEGVYEGATLAAALADLDALLDRFLAAPEAPVSHFLALLDARAEEREEARRQELRDTRQERFQRAARRKVEAPGTGS